MSGGHFDYIQHRLTEVIEQIKDEIQKSGKPKTKDELKDEFWRDDEWYAKYPEDLNHHKYNDEVIKEFKKGVEIITLAQIYMQRIDWLLSGDDGEETFLERLKEDKSNIKK